LASGNVMSMILLVLLIVGEPSNQLHSAALLARLNAAFEVYSGRRLLTTGTYLERVPLTYAVDGWLEDGEVRLRILGPLFDWKPLPDQRIDVWGVLRRDRGLGELVLDFFNGRPAGDHRRVPRLVPALHVGHNVWLVGRLRQTGSEPLVRWVLALEDRTQIELLGVPPLKLTAMSGALIQVQGRVESGALPPSAAAIRLLRIQQLPGPPPPPFGG